jgi:transcriptional regulator with XRE-family HTH domain
VATDRTALPSSLGRRLREHREAKGWSLRDVASRSGVNHGYLSLLERGEVAEPAPSMLHRLADGYELPFIVLMRWAGYIEADEISETQAVALKYLGDDVTPEELTAVKAVLDAIRSSGSPFSYASGSLDLELTAERRAEIRQQTLRLLRKADCLHVIPTPLDQVMEVARLVSVGEVTLNDDDRRRLRERFGSLVDTAISRLMGAIHLRSREVWVAPDLHVLRKRFVIAHEIGHDVLPWQRDSIGYLEDEERLRHDVRIEFEREANQAAIELLAHGDRLNREADDSPLTTSSLAYLMNKYQISLQAGFRKVVEDSKQPAATLIRFRGSGALGRAHLYSSVSFEARFVWGQTGVPAEIRRAVREGFNACTVPDRSGTFAELGIEILNTPYARLVLVVPQRVPKRRIVLRAG